MFQGLTPLDLCLENNISQSDSAFILAGASSRSRKAMVGVGAPVEEPLIRTTSGSAYGAQGMTWSDGATCHVMAEATLETRP